MVSIIKGKTEKVKITKVNSEKWAITTDPIDIKRIIKEHYKQFPINKCGSLTETNKIFGKYNLPKLPKKKTQNLNSYNY